jgi:hypothetical protein
MHNEPVKTRDLHRILFTEALSIFAPYSISGVEAAEAHYTDRRRTRADIAWAKLSGKPLDPQERYQVGLILVGYALGIVVKTIEDGALRFSTQATPLNPSRSFVLCRNSDVADASYGLGRDPLAAQDLRSQVERAISTDIARAAQDISRFNASVHERTLRIGTREIDNPEAFVRELDFLQTIPGLLTAIHDRYPDFDARAGNWVLDPGNNEKNPAYRCNRCRQFLAPSGIVPPEGLPEICPNANCGQRIRYDKIVGF